MCDFLGVDCKYSVKTCQGIKVCELAGNQITSATHQEVDVEKDFSMKRNSISTQQQIIINTQMYVVFFFNFNYLNLQNFNSDFINI
jgi:hypothetical protein